MVGGFFYFMAVGLIFKLHNLFQFMPKSYLFFLPVFLTLTISVYGQIDDELKNEIRIRTEQLRGAGLFVGGEKICCGQSISNVYSDRIFSPIWTDSLANQLLRQIENSELEGLFPEDYHYSLLKCRQNYFQKN